jgi:hypothetical protein
MDVGVLSAPLHECDSAHQRKSNECAYAAVSELIGWTQEALLDLAR